MYMALFLLLHMLFIALYCRHRWESSHQTEFQLLATGTVH